MIQQLKKALLKIDSSLVVLLGRISSNHQLHVDHAAVRTINDKKDQINAINEYDFKTLRTLQYKEASLESALLKNYESIRLKIISVARKALHKIRSVAK